MGNLTKEDILKGIESMTVMELAELIKTLEDRFGVTAAAPVAVAPAQVGAAKTVEETQSTVSVILANAGDKKIQVIKVVRELTGLGLKESKDLVEAAPKSLKEGISKDEAEKIKAKFEGSGATIEIK